MITGVISSNLVDKPCPNDRVHTRMFVLINSYSLDNVLLGNQSEIPKTKKTPVTSERATFKKGPYYKKAPPIRDRFRIGGAFL